jgi:UDP-N-acetylmuramoyl-tripeptide--D-alanyl-D-alanine ligase
VKNLRIVVRDYMRRSAASLKRRKNRAKLIAISGSSAKSTTTTLLTHILAGTEKVQSLVQPRIIDEIVDATADIENDTGYFVAEVSIGQVGHLKKMLDMMRPIVGLITFVGIEHHKIYRTRERVAAEKSQIIRAIPPSGIAILNADDDLVLAMQKLAKGRVATFGRDNSEADYRVTSARAIYPEPLSLEICWNGHLTKVSTRIIGEHFWLPVVAAFAAAIELGIPVDQIVERIASYEPLMDRCQPYRIENGPTFLLDTVKSPWQTVSMAIDVIKTARAKRKRIVFGHMSDFPGNANPKYRDTYSACRNASDQVIFVGEHSHRSKASQQDRDSGRFKQFFSVRQASEYLQANCDQTDLILLKSSKNLHLERIALAAHCDVRCWEDRCGVRESCFVCGLYEFPFETHAQIRKLAEKKLEEKKKSGQ